MEVNFIDIKNKVKIALDMLIAKDSYLLLEDVNERSLSHKLAEYIQILFSSWHVDCEYNKNLGETKGLMIPEDNVDYTDLEAKTVYPDIIIHIRGTAHNLVVIEIKKSKYAKEKFRNSTKTKKEFDFDKLKGYTSESQLKYEHGVYIEFDKNGVIDSEIFQKGEKLEVWKGCLNSLN